MLEELLFIDFNWKKQLLHLWGQTPGENQFKLLLKKKKKSGDVLVKICKNNKLYVCTQ